MMHLGFITRLIAAMAAIAPLHAGEIHVSPHGNDRQPGTKEAPLKTPEAARAAARAMVGREPVTVIFHDGVYHLSAPLVFSHADSGTAGAPVVYKAANEGKAVLSGGVPLKPDWQPFSKGIFMTRTPAGLEIDQLFVNGERQHMARYPDYDPAKPTVAYRGAAADAFSPERAARWADPAGGYIHAMHAHLWGGFHYRITGKNERNEVLYEGGWQNNRPSGMHPKLRMVENIREELDAPGEWFHDKNASVLYFMPPAGLDLANAAVEGVRLANLVSFKGSKEKPVRFIALDGLVFRHSARTFMENKEPLLRSDWTVHRGGAVFFEGAEDCAILNSFIDQPGGNAVFASNYNRRLRFAGMHVRGCGASAFAFVGDPKAVRNPVFGYGSPHDPAAADRTPGPLTDNYPMECTVEDSLIHEVGTVEKQGAGVQISMSRRITVRHCSIYDTSRAGININEGTWGGHLIEGCDVFNTVQETGDHGSFNSWGRDRFWVPDTATTARAVATDPGLPFLDAVEKTVIRNSRWRCDHGWDIDLDDGSSNYEITNNLLLRGGLKLREGYRRIVTGNIIVNNGLHPHVWYPDSGDVFTANIVMKAHQPALMSADAKWGREIDRNLYTTSHRDRMKFAANGCDANSLVGDPMFADPASGDFTVRNEKLAAAIGFRNFPMDRFGVQKPSLRKLARRPDMPGVQIQPDITPVAADPKTQSPVIWHGAALSEPRGEALSAFGLSLETRGVAIESLAADSPLGGPHGLRQGDLILSLNNRKTESIASLKDIAASVGKGRLVFQISRNQQTTTIAIDPK
jgi:hypothetical protein